MRDCSFAISSNRLYAANGSKQYLQYRSFVSIEVSGVLCAKPREHLESAARTRELRLAIPNFRLLFCETTSEREDQRIVFFLSSSLQAFGVSVFFLSSFLQADRRSRTQIPTLAQDALTVFFCLALPSNCDLFFFFSCTQWVPAPPLRPPIGIVLSTPPFLPPRTHLTNTHPALPRSA